MAKSRRTKEAVLDGPSTGAMPRSDRPGTAEGTVEMGHLGAVERRSFEKLLGMENGAILGFSDRTFRTFVREVVDLDISEARYAGEGAGDADRLRAFCMIESEHVVAELLEALLDRAEREGDPEDSLLAVCRHTVARLRRGIGYLTPSPEGHDFDVVAGAVRRSIEANAPEVGLDRLHTFVASYVSGLAEQEGLTPATEMPLSALFEDVVGALRLRGAIESQMAERILDSAISTLEWFDEVRGSRPFGRDDPLLSYNEALFIFDHVSSVVRFLATVAGPSSVNLTWR